MHNSSMRNMERALMYVLNQPDIQNKNGPVHVLDMGAQRTQKRHRTYRDILQAHPSLFANWKYTGADVVPGDNVDVVLQHSNAPHITVGCNTFDIVISGQTLEHVQHPWLWIQGIAHILKPGGWAILIAPSEGPVHWKYDYWRYKPQGMETLLQCGGFKRELIWLDKTRPWCDCVAIGRLPE